MEAPDNTAPSQLNTLESWKAIARYLHRDVRTVQRWEQEEGLPVHRHQHGKQATVYAVPEEIDAWRERLDSSPGKQAPTALRNLVPAIIIGAILVAGGFVFITRPGQENEVDKPTLVGSGTDAEPALGASSADEVLTKAWETFDRFDPVSLESAEALFSEAADAMPEAAEPHAGMALANVAKAFFEVTPAREAYSKAEKESLAALNLDADHGDAKAVLGWVEFVYRWNWHGAERLMLEAVEDDPNSIWPRWILANYYSAQGRGGEAVAQIDLAMAIDPQSAYTLVGRGYILANAGYPEAAVEHWSSVVEQLGLQRVGYFLRNAYEKCGDFESAISISKQLGYPFIDVIEDGYREGGVQGYWAKSAILLDQRLAKFPDAFSHRLAVAAANGGDHELALAMLERGYHLRDPRMVFLPVYALKPLYGEPAFKSLVSDMQLESAFDGRLP